VIYLDTSVLGALFFRKPTAPAILARLESVDDDDLCISAWTLAEMASVGAIKERTRSIDAVRRAEGLAAFNRFVSDSLTLTEVVPGDFRTAAILLDTPARWLCVRAMPCTWPSPAACGQASRHWMHVRQSQPIITASRCFWYLDFAA
jgi:predicted nucleic acid-binding protein